MSEEFSTGCISTCDAGEQCIASGWYLPLERFMSLGEVVVVPFETESTAL